MKNHYQRIKPYVNFHSSESKWDAIARIRSKLESFIPKHVPQGNSGKDIRKRWELLNIPDEYRDALINREQFEDDEERFYNIENVIGTVKIPVGLAGPLRINGMNAQGDYYVPLATLESTLVASYSRGAQCITKAGGCSTVLLDEGVMRAPGFMFSNIIEATDFANWISDNYAKLKEAGESTTRFGKLIDMKISIQGKYVWLIFDYTTGDAIGQNMVTIATNAILGFIMENSPVNPVFSTIDANMCGDKKATMQTFTSVRGRRVTAEVVIPAEVCKDMLNTTPEKMDRYVRMSYLGGVSSGTLGMQGQLPNALAALYIACGQDAGCVSEASGVTHMEITENNDLYAMLTIPNIMVGTVGAVSKFPSQKACLEILGLNGPNMSSAFAEVCVATCLAGEISMIASLSFNEFSKSHERSARGIKIDDK